MQTHPDVKLLICGDWREQGKLVALSRMEAL